MSRNSSKNQGTRGGKAPTKGYQEADQEEYEDDLELQQIKSSKSTKNKEQKLSVPGMLKELSRHTSNLEQCFNKLGTNEDNKALKKKN